MNFMKKHNLRAAWSLCAMSFAVVIQAQVSIADVELIEGCEGVVTDSGWSILTGQEGDYFAEMLVALERFSGFRWDQPEGLAADQNVHQRVLQTASLVQRRPTARRTAGRLGARDHGRPCGSAFRQGTSGTCSQATTARSTSASRST